MQENALWKDMVNKKPCKEPDSSGYDGGIFAHNKTRPYNEKSTCAKCIEKKPHVHIVNKSW